MPADFPAQVDSGMVQHARPHQFSKGFNIRRCRGTGIDQEITVFLADLGAADLQAPAPGRINQFPARPCLRCARRIWIGESRTTGLVLDRLGLRPAFLMRSNVLGQLIRIASRLSGQM